MKNVSIKYIEIACKKTGLKQKDLAPLIGVSPQQISNLNNGSELKDDSLIRLAQFAQIPANKILSEKHIKLAKGKAEREFWVFVAKSKEMANCILCSIQKNPNFI